MHTKINMSLPEELLERINKRSEHSDDNFPGRGGRRSGVISRDLKLAYTLLDHYRPEVREKFTSKDISKLKLYMHLLSDTTNPLGIQRLLMDLAKSHYRHDLCFKLAGLTAVESVTLIDILEHP